MFDIFDKPPTKWNGMDFAEYNMLTNNAYNTERRKHKTGCSGCGCFTTVIVAIVVLIFISVLL